MASELGLVEVTVILCNPVPIWRTAASSVRFNDWCGMKVRHVTQLLMLSRRVARFKSVLGLSDSN